MSRNSEAKRQQRLRNRQETLKRKIARRVEKDDTEKKAPGFLRFFAAAQKSWKGVVSVLSVIALLTGLEYAYRPLLKIEGGRILSAEKPFENPFLLTNTSRYSVYNLRYEIGFDDERLTGPNFDVNFKDVGFGYGDNVGLVKELESNKSTSIKVNNLINPKTAGAKFRVEVKANYSLPSWIKWIPWYKDATSQYFEVAQGDDGKYAWLEIAK